MEWMNEQKKTFIKNYIEKYKMLLYLQPEIRKCWEFFLHLNKMNTKRLSNHMSQYFFTTEHREHKCLHREILHTFPLNELISNLMPATSCNKKVGMGATKGWKSKQIWKDSAERTAGN